MSCPNHPPQGWSGARETALEQLERKTRANMIARDYAFIAPFQLTSVSSVPPMGGYCQPMIHQGAVGLTQSQIVNGENEMVLYSTFTRCPGEFDDRFMSMHF